MFPNITKDNAAQMARLSSQSRKRNNEMRKAWEEKQANASGENGIEKTIETQIKRVADKMNAAKSNKEIARLAGVLEKLWNMVYPKAGSRKPGRGDNARKPVPQAQHEFSVANDVATQGNDTQDNQ